MAASPKNQEIYDLLAAYQKLDLKTPEPIIAARIAQERAESEHRHVTELREVRHREKWDYFVMLVFAAAAAFCSVIIYKTHPPDDSSRSASTILAGIISAAAAYAAGRKSK